jgi:nucleoside-diphosphate-sugar epimerase
VFILLDGKESWKMSEKKKILVTGGSGKAGSWVINDLLANGYEVTNVDLKPSRLAHTYSVDLCDLGQTFGVVEGKDAIVHLAAIPWPGEHAPEVVLRNNTLSTFNILQAATVLGVKKIVMAGSESALGFPFMFRRFNPESLPIDETHPLLAQDAYGLSKILGEELAKGFARRDPSLSILVLRLSYIIPPDTYAEELRLAWSEIQRNDFNLWAYVDARDVALACRLSLEYPQPGFEAFYIAAPDTLMREPTLELVEQCYPGVPRIAPEFEGRMSPLDCRKAEVLLGFKAGYTWNRMVDPDNLG